MRTSDYHNAEKSLPENGQRVFVRVNTVRGMQQEFRAVVWAGKFRCTDTSGKPFSIDPAFFREAGMDVLWRWPTAMAHRH